MSKILIAGDLLPSEGNYSLFEQGDARALFGNEICNMFAEADYSIFNLEGPLTDSDKMLFKDGPGIKAPSQMVNGIKNLGVKYFKRRKALTLWEREENSTPHKMFYLSKNTNWSASTIEEVKHSLLSISHYLIHSEEV